MNGSRCKVLPKSDAFLADFGLVSCREERKIPLERALFDDYMNGRILVMRPPDEMEKVAYPCCTEPRQMENRKGCCPVKESAPSCAADNTKAITHPNRLVLDPRFLRSVRDLPRSTRQTYKRIRAGRNGMHLSEKRHKQRGLSCTRRAEDEVDASALE